MELIDLISLHIALPVIGVVVCALAVFAFGFRAPVQPPSFNFDDEKRSRRRNKQTKPKGGINGLVAANDQASETLSKTSNKPSKEAKAASPSKSASSLKSVASTRVEVNASKNVTKKELKQEKGEKKAKLKKVTVSEETKVDGAKRNTALSTKKETEEDGEWTTILVSKKSKKQKSDNKRDSGQAESAFELDSEPENAPTPVSDAAAASAVITSEVEQSSSPKARRNKKKEKLSVKVRPEDKEEPIVTTPLVKQDSQDQNDGKKKKNKKDKKPSGADAAASGAAENIFQDVAASGKDVKKKLSQPSVVSDINTEQAKQSHVKKKSKGKENIQEENVVKTKDVQLKEVKKASEPVKKETEVTPLKEVKKTVTVKKDSEIQLKEVTKSSDPIKKDKIIHKKDVKKLADPDKSEADIQLKEITKPVDIIKKETKKSKTKPQNKALQVDSGVSTAALLTEESNTTNTVSDIPANVDGISFDEIGDSWQEAAPKNKKKKARKDN